MALHASPTSEAPQMPRIQESDLITDPFVHPGKALPIAEPTVANPQPIMPLGEVVADEEAPGVEIAVGTEEAVQCGFWGSNDGKWGTSTKVWVRPRQGETLQEASKRATRLATQTYRELWEIMSGD